MLRSRVSPHKTIEPVQYSQMKGRRMDDKLHRVSQLVTVVDTPQFLCLCQQGSPIGSRGIGF